eukprot:scaffold31245_cov115-Isochrysis_galbana.AAC.3
MRTAKLGDVALGRLLELGSTQPYCLLCHGSLNHVGPSEAEVTSTSQRLFDDTPRAMIAAVAAAIAAASRTASCDGALAESLLAQPAFLSKSVRVQRALSDAGSRRCFEASEVDLGEREQKCLMMAARWPPRPGGDRRTTYGGSGKLCLVLDFALLVLPPPPPVCSSEQEKNVNP